MIRDYQLSIPAGGSVTQQATGSYIALMRSSMDTQIIRVECIGQSGEIVANVGLFQGEKIPQTGKPFTSVRLTNPGATDVVVTIVAGEGAYQSDRLSGVVSVDGVVNINPIQGANYDSYIKEGGYTPPSGYYVAMTLENPSDSNKNIHVYSFGIETGSSGGFLMQYDQGSSISVAEISSSAAKLTTSGVVADAVGVFKTYRDVVRMDARVIGTPTIVGTLINVDSAGKFEKSPKKPIILKPGAWLAAFSKGASQTINITAEWEEVLSV